MMDNIQHSSKHVTNSKLILYIGQKIPRTTENKEHDFNNPSYAQTGFLSDYALLGDVIAVTNPTRVTNVFIR
jgi:hypothetical protein